MLFSKVFRQKGLGFPYVTLCLVLSCLVISIPLFFSSDFYHILGGGQGVNVNFWWQVITTRFSHGRGIPLLPHLLGNVIAFAFFGTVIERLLGSGRFFLLSLATFSVATAWRTIAASYGNGASGICWGYLVFIVPILVWIWQKNKKQVLRDIAYILAIGYALFMLLGIPILAWITGVKGNMNFSHMVSLLTALPFFLVWRKTIFQNLVRLDKDESLDRGRPIWGSIAVTVGAILLLFNLIVSTGTVTGLFTYSGEAAPKAISIIPPNGDIETLNKHQQKATIRFDRPMETKLYELDVSIYGHDENGPVGFTFDWPDAETLTIQFGRELDAGERIDIRIGSLRATDGLWSYEPVELKYE